MSRKRTEESPIYMFHCNACGDRFEALRSDTRFCSDICRITVRNKFSRLKEKVVVNTPEDIKKQEQAEDSISVKLMDSSDNLIKGILKIKKTEPVLKVSKTVIRDLSSNEGPQPIAAAQGAKVAKPVRSRKNDKHLIPGKKTADGLPAKKKKKGGKK